METDSPMDENELEEAEDNNQTKDKNQPPPTFGHFSNLTHNLKIILSLILQTHILIIHTTKVGLIIMIPPLQIRENFLKNN